MRFLQLSWGLRSKTLFLAFFLNFFNFHLAFAEQQCGEIRKSYSENFEKTLTCIRKNCPGVSLAISVNDPNFDLNCSKGCPPLDASMLPKVTEADLERCKVDFNSPDEKDFFDLTWCNSTASAMAKLYVPYIQCVQRTPCFRNLKAVQAMECIGFCEIETRDLMEVLVTAAERCTAFPNAIKGICVTIENAVNRCSIPDQCSRLEQLMLEHCAKK